MSELNSKGIDPKLLDAQSTGKRALFVSGSPQGVSVDLLQALAGESDFILAVDAGANQLEAAGITPDLILGDFDSVDSAVLLRYEDKGVATESHDAYKNATDVELGIESLLQKGYTDLVASNVLGGRTDHALGSLGALAGAHTELGMHVVIRDDSELCFFLNSGPDNNHIELELANLARYAVGTYPKQVSLVSWGGSTTVSLKGTEWELDHHELSPYSARGISNLWESGKLQLTVHEGSGTTLLLLTY